LRDNDRLGEKRGLELKRGRGSAACQRERKEKRGGTEGGLDE